VGDPWGAAQVRDHAGTGVGTGAAGQFQGRLALQHQIDGDRCRPVLQQPAADQRGGEAERRIGQPRQGSVRVGAMRKASPSRMVSRPSPRAAAKRRRRLAERSGSRSTATTWAPAVSRQAVRAPWPAPTSSTRSSLPMTAERTTMAATSAERSCWCAWLPASRSAAGGVPDMVVGPEAGRCLEPGRERGGFTGHPMGGLGWYAGRVALYVGYMQAPGSSASGDINPLIPPSIGGCHGPRPVQGAGIQPQHPSYFTVSSMRSSCRSATHRCSC
jgi:hypothetical protein